MVSMDSELLLKLSPLFDKFTPLYFKKGQVIIRPEDKIENIYFIEKGYVKFYYVSEEGKELTFLIYKPGYLFPILYTFFGQKTRYYFEALTPVVLRRVPREIFTNLVSTDNSISLLINKEIILRLQGLLSKMEYLSLGSAHQNVAFAILICAQEFGKKKNKSIVLNLPLAHKDIASMVGLTRETVSVEMKRLEKEGLILYKRNQITIKNVDKFRDKDGVELNYEFI